MKGNNISLWNLALDGITSFTTTLLKIAIYFGLVTACGAFVYGGVIKFKTLMYGDPVVEYPSLMLAIMFCAGMQLMILT